MIERVLIVVNTLTVFVHDFIPSQGDPSLMGGLLSALRMSAKEQRDETISYAQYGESHIVFTVLPGRPEDFVAVIATLLEDRESLVRFARQVSESFVLRYSSLLDGLAINQRLFAGFSSAVARIAAAGAWASPPSQPLPATKEFSSSTALGSLVLFSCDPSPLSLPYRVGDRVVVTFTIYNISGAVVHLGTIGNAVPEPFFSLQSLDRHMIIRGAIFLHDAPLPCRCLMLWSW